MTDTPRQITVELTFSEDDWNAITADYRGLWRNMLDDQTAEDTPLSERIELFIEVQVSGWCKGVAEPSWSGDLDDGVPF